MLERVTGRCVHVELADDSDREFVVTLGPPPNLVTFRGSGQPPHLGQLVTVEGEVASRESISAGGATGSLTQLGAPKWMVDEATYASRHVPLPWLQRVRKVMSRTLYDYQVEGAAWVAQRLASGKGASSGTSPAPARPRRRSPSSARSRSGPWSSSAQPR
jgi:hypothetical protein